MLWLVILLSVIVVGLGICCCWRLFVYVEGLQDDLVERLRAEKFSMASKAQDVFERAVLEDRRMHPPTVVEGEPIPDWLMKAAERWSIAQRGQDARPPT